MIAIMPHHKNILVSKEIAKEDEKKKLTKLLKEKKLALILDLDKTLLHAGENHTLIKNYPHFINVVEASEEIKEWHPIRLGREVLYIKFRPYLREFIEKSSRLFELHVYTHGTRNYADQILNILDPHKKFFQNRVTTANENYLKSKNCIFFFFFFFF